MLLVGWQAIGAGTRTASSYVSRLARDFVQDRDDGELESMSNRIQERLAPDTAAAARHALHVVQRSPGHPPTGSASYQPAGPPPAGPACNPAQCAARVGIAASHAPQAVQSLTRAQRLRPFWTDSLPMHDNAPSHREPRERQPARAMLQPLDRRSSAPEVLLATPSRVSSGGVLGLSRGLKSASLSTGGQPLR